MGSKEVPTPERAEVSEPAHQAPASAFHTEFDCIPWQRCSPLSVVLVGLPLWGFPSPTDYLILFFISSTFAHIFAICFRVLACSLGPRCLVGLSVLVVQSISRSSWLA